MGLINEILGFFIKRRDSRISDFKNYPIEKQEEMFSSLIYRAKGTEWGKKYNYKHIEKISQFQETVPISTYEQLFPYIDRLIKGENNLLWPTNTVGFAKSSGTTNARSKFIPVTEESLEECHYKGGKDLITFVFQNKPDTKIFDGKGLSIAGSLSKNPDNSQIPFGDISALITSNLPTWAEFVRTPPLDIALLDNWDEKLKKIVEICSKENVTSVLGVPTWSVVLFDHLLEKNGAENMLDIWPNFEVFVHGAVSFKPYREFFRKKYFPDPKISFFETYNASEGFFGLQDDLNLEDEMLLMLDYGIFYEFIPIEELGKDSPKTILLENVELDRNYALVISTNAGLWRYMIGDTIKFTSLNPFRIKISGRTKHFINAFGEELIIENAENAISDISHKLNINIVEFTAGPCYMGDGTKGKHEWIIETTSEIDNKKVFCKLLDEKIREINSDYDAKRTNNLALEQLSVRFVPVGTFYKWMETRGKLGGQHKVPRLSNNRDYLESILSMLG